MSHKDEGLAALRAGNAQAAVDRLRQAVREAPDGQSWAGLGVALCQLGRAGEGAQALEQAISFNPTQAPLHYNLGRALELQARPSEALKAYQQTVALDPNHQAAQDALRRLSPAAPTTTAAPGAPPSPLPTAAPVTPPPPPQATTASAVSEFILTPTAAAAPAPPAASGWSNGAPLPPPPSSMGGGYAASMRPPAAAPPPPPVGYPDAPAAIGAPGGMPLPKPVPVSGGFPWVAVLLGVGAIGCVGVIILAAVLFPVFAQARQAAIRARRRAIAAGGGPTSNWPNPTREPDGASPFGINSGGTPGIPGIRTASKGPDLNSSTPGPKIDDRRNAFSVALPGGFRPAMPMPGMMPLGMAGMGRMASYNSRSGAAECQVLCLTFPSAQFDQMTPAETFGRLRERLASSLHSRVTRTQQGNFAGNPSEDDRMDGGTAGGHYIRTRMVWAKPRILLLMFGGTQESDLERPAVNRYFESLEIGSNVDTGGLSDPVKIPDPHLTAPPPISTPPISAPHFTPPPAPHFTPPPTPQFGTPNGSPSFGGSTPGGDPSDGASPAGPSFGPRFRRPSFGPRFGPPGSAPGFGPGGPPFGPGGSPQFGPGGAPANGTP